MRLVIGFLLLTFTSAAFATPPTLIFKNQFGEQTQANILGGNFIGAQIAANTIPANLTGSTAYPTANSYAAVSAKLTPAMLLTGFVAGAGTVASTDTVLQGFNKLVGNQNQLRNGTFVPTTETVSAAGALSTTIMESLITNAGSTFAVTLAAPSSQDGQLKVIKAVTAMAGTITLAMTNIAIGGGYTARGTTTLTFTSIGDSAVFMALGGKWVYLGGSAVAS